jgi:hypothetical protein
LFTVMLVVMILAVTPWDYVWRRYMRAPGDPWPLGLGSVRGFGLAPVPSGALDRRFVRYLGAPYARFPFREIDALDEQPQREGQLGDEARDKEHDVREVRRD